MNYAACKDKVSLNKDKSEQLRILKLAKEQKIFEGFYIHLIEKMLETDYKKRIDSAQAFEDVYKNFVSNIVEKKELQLKQTKAVEEMNDQIKNLKEKKRGLQIEEAKTAQEIRNLLSQLLEVLA